MFELKSLPENRNESIERNTSIEHQDSTMFNCHTPPLEKSKPGGYESVVIEGDVPALSSEGNGSVHGDIEIVRQHNKEYLQHQTEEEKKLNKSPISTQPVEYAQVNETTKLKNEKKQYDTDQETVDTNAEIHEGIQVESEERHAKTENDDHLDKTKIIRPSTTVSSMENMDEMLKYRNANSCDNSPDHTSSVPGIYYALHDKRHKTNNGETYHKNRIIERNTSIEHQDSTMFNCHTPPLEKSKPGGYESVVIEGDVPALSSEGNGSVHGDIEIVRQHNKEYLQHQTEEEKKLNKSPISTQPVEYAQVNETTKSKNKKKHNDTDQETVDTSAKIHEGIKVESEEMHAKTDENDDHLDKTKIIR
ncbi:unnamed protein product [Mytilus coruscus]|uniref:Uncharacterized protein n=1 Tax=Mytilus coruscus TaxID=42192 RepID=A0A6J8A9D6_MYTCO|nr:unnamed protein product [Mytilus coruscus]